MEIYKNKQELIIEPNYKPNINDSLIDYFNKSLVFAQTNYKQQIESVVRANFGKLSPTIFLEQYAWCLYCSNMKVNTVSSFFPSILIEIRKLYPSIRDPNHPIQKEEFSKNILAICKNKKKMQALLDTIIIVQNGIRLFGWDKYKHNFISTPDKIAALPYMGKVNSRHLSRNIGLIKDVCGGVHMNRLCSRWGFNSPIELCQEIQKHVLLRLQVIELILWLSASNFGTNIRVR